MPKKPTFTEDLDDLDDILDDKPAKPAPAAVEDDDLDLDAPTPDEKKPAAVVEEEIDLDNDGEPAASPAARAEFEDDEDGGQHSGVEVRAEKCEFKIMSDDFLKFLQKIELGGFIKDGYIKVENDKLYCTFTDQNTGALYGFVGLNTDKGVEITKSGSFIIQDMKKMSKIVSLLSGKIVVSYDNGSIRVASANSKKSAKVISYDKGYVDSLSGMASTVVDLEKGKIGNHNFLAGSSFSVKKEHLKEILEASEAIDNAEFKFNATAENDEITVYVSNEQDRITVPFKVLNANIKADFKNVFSFPALNKVIKVLDEDIQVFVTPAFILFKSNTGYYLYMSNETNE